MGRYSEWWFSRFSEDWQDLTTFRGLVGGVLSLVSNGTVFALSLVLAVLLESVSLRFGASGPDHIFAIQWFFITIASAVGGGGWLYLYQHDDRIRHRMQTFPARGVAICVFYGGFWVLLLYNATLAIWAGLAYVIGKGLSFSAYTLAVVGNCHSRRNRHDTPSDTVVPGRQ